MPLLRSYRSQLDYDPITAVPCRAKTLPLPRASILFRPRGSPALEAGEKLVEAPGTAPGSATLIPQAVYRHSRLPDNCKYRIVWRAEGKPGCVRRVIASAEEQERAMTPEQQAESTSARRTAGRPGAPPCRPWRRSSIAPLPVLDHGFVRVVDYMGDDARDRAGRARLLWPRHPQGRARIRGLIHYLMRHRHTTPFEMCEIKFHVKLPIFVARQWIRHRTANVNEYSARYSILDNEFYLPAPEHLAAQAATNRQGRGDVLDGEEAARVSRPAARGCRAPPTPTTSRC